MRERYASAERHLACPARLFPESRRFRDSCLIPLRQPAQNFTSIMLKTSPFPRTILQSNPVCVAGRAGKDVCPT